MAVKSKKKQEVTFASRSPNLHVVLDPRRSRLSRDAAGNVVASEVVGGSVPEGSYVGQKNGPVSGVVFKNRSFTTDDPEIIKALRNHDDLGSKWGFIEVFDASRPTVPVLNERIAGLAAEGDTDGLAKLIEEESSFGDGGRAEVLGPARAAHERLTSDSGAEAAGADSGKKKSKSGKAKASDPGSTD